MRHESYANHNLRKDRIFRLYGFKSAEREIGHLQNLSQGC